VPTLLITVSPVKAAKFVMPTEAALPKAALRQLAGCGTGARLHEGAQAGSPGGMTVSGALPRLPWIAVDASAVPARGGYQPISRTQFEHMTRINPDGTGELGPHPEREPEPV
jgi:hypothetical protein